MIEFIVSCVVVLTFSILLGMFTFGTALIVGALFSTAFGLFIDVFVISFLIGILFCLRNIK